MSEEYYNLRPDSDELIPGTLMIDLEYASINVSFIRSSVHLYRLYALDMQSGRDRVYTLSEFVGSGFRIKNSTAVFLPEREDDER